MPLSLSSAVSNCVASFWNLKPVFLSGVSSWIWSNSWWELWWGEVVKGKGTLGRSLASSSEGAAMIDLLEL